MLMVVIYDLRMLLDEIYHHKSIDFLFASFVVRDLMTASVRIGSKRSKGYGKDACNSHCCLTTVVLQRFSEDEVILAELVHLSGTADVDGTGASCGLRSSCGVGYAVRG